MTGLPQMIEPRKRGPVLSIEQMRLEDAERVSQAAAWSRGALGLGRPLPATEALVLEQEAYARWLRGESDEWLEMRKLVKPRTEYIWAGLLPA